MEDKKLQKQEQDSNAENKSGTQEAGNAQDAAKEVENKQELSLEAMKAELERARKEAASYRIKSKKLEQAQSDLAKKQLEEQQKYKELYEKIQSEKEELEGKIELEKQQKELAKIAKKAGFRDPQDIRLLDLSDIELDGTDNSVLEARIIDLKKNKPYLFSESSGTGTPTGATGDGRKKLASVKISQAEAFDINKYRAAKAKADKEGLPLEII